MRRHPQKPQRRISAVLRDLAARPDEATALGELSTAFGPRVFGAFFILFGGINLIPLPPGASTIAGVPLILVAAQLAFGRQRLWLPDRFSRMPVKTSVLRKLTEKMVPLLRRVERLARPRFWPGLGGLIEPAIGWLALVLAILVAIPMPFTNMFPGVAIALLGVSITARDGLWLCAALVIASGSILFLTAFYGGALLALLALI